jgi:hypothetical protein
MFTDQKELIARPNFGRLERFLRRLGQLRFGRTTLWFVNQQLTPKLVEQRKTFDDCFDRLLYLFLPGASRSQSHRFFDA